MIFPYVSRVKGENMTIFRQFITLRALKCIIFVANLATLEKSIFFIDDHRNHTSSFE